MSVLGRALVLLVFTFLILGSALYGVAATRVRRAYDIPAPPIARATAPDDIARGASLARTLCFTCHAPGPGQAPVGARVDGAPSFLGEVWAPNLTADRETGIGAVADGDIARLLRNGVGRDRHYAATMSRFARLGDEDVAALLGYLRSSDPLVAPRPHAVPPPRLGIVGTIVLAFAVGIDTRGEAHVPVPARAPTADYGRYLASVIYGCVDCHTDGVAPADEKLRSPGLLGGGLALHGAHNLSLFSPNLSPDPDFGIGRWSLDDLARALVAGADREGRPLRAPMPRFADLTVVDIQAIYAFVRSVPPVHRPTPISPPRVATTR